MLKKLKKSSLTPKTIPTDIVTMATQEAAQRLNAFFNRKDISIRDPQRDDSAISAFSTQWGVATFHWNNGETALSYNSPSSGYKWALFQGENLCALASCVTDFKAGTLWKKPTPIIQLKLIESAPKRLPNLLAGFTIATATMINDAVAQTMDIPHLGVLKPHPQTRRTYHALGYSPDSELIRETGSPICLRSYAEYRKQRDALSANPPRSNLRSPEFLGL